MKNIILFSLMAVALIFNSCKKCEEVKLRPCGSSEDNPMVDLIVLIDASGSMGGVAQSLSDAVELAISSALDSCTVDAQFTFLGVDDPWNGTVFNRSHKDYIFSNNGNVQLAGEIPPVGLETEQGANAIEDLSNYAAWREGACRAIFYISDEQLDSSDPSNDYDNEDLATSNAIRAAQNNSVAVFTHFINDQNHDSRILQNYNDLTSQTGGSNMVSHSDNDVNSQLYINMMPSIVCNACNGCNLSQFFNE